MYKWHVHSALGRGRPLQSDLGRVADGIAVSLRQFHVSCPRAEDAGERGKPISIRIPQQVNSTIQRQSTFLTDYNALLGPSTRSKRLAQTSQEIQSLVSRLNSSSSAIPSSKPNARGALDARSLAVKPEGAPVITFATNVRGGFRGGFRGSSDGMRGGFGRGGIIRGGLRGGLGLRARGGLRGRGRGGPGAGGRGGRGGRGRGRGSRRRGGDGNANPTGRAGKFQYTDKELEYMEQKRVKEAGERVPFQPPALSAEVLYTDGPGPAVVIGELGMAEIVDRQMRALAERPAGWFERNAELAKRLLKGDFVKFVSEAEKDAVLKEAARLSADRAVKLSERKGEVVESDFEGFEPADSKALMSVFYLDQGTGATADESVMARTTRGNMRNETYGIDSGDAFRGEVRKRLPQERKNRGIGPAKQAA